jgi:hypothetical protein
MSNNIINESKLYLSVLCMKKVGDFPFRTGFMNCKRVSRIGHADGPDVCDDLGLTT